MPWTLGSHDGSRRIFVQLQNAAGQVSGNLSTAVSMDQTPPRVVKPGCRHRVARPRRNWLDQDPTQAGRQRMVWRFRTR